LQEEFALHPMSLQERPLQSHTLNTL
jgi:hypothetical protein